MDKLKVIKVSKEITLREIDYNDELDIFNTIDSQRPYLGKWLPFVDFTNTPADTRNYIQMVKEAPAETREYVFVIRYINSFAGIAGFKCTEHQNRKTEIGYWLSEIYQKKGIMTQCIKAMMSFAYNEFNINRIQIKCAVGNTPSSNIPKRLGFKFEGIERAGELLADGNFADIEVYSKLRNE